MTVVVVSDEVTRRVIAEALAMYLTALRRRDRDGVHVDSREVVVAGELLRAVSRPGAPGRAGSQEVGEPKEHPQAGPVFVDAAEAARRLGIGTRTLWGLTRDGKVPVAKVGTRVLYRPADLEAFAARQVSRARRKEELA